MTMLRDLFTSHYFFIMASLTALFSSIPAAIIGSYVVVRRIVFLTGSISHAVIGGMGIFLFIQRTFGLTFFSPTLGAFVFALLAACLMGWVHLYSRQREDTVIAALWTLGMSIGILFLSFTPGYNVEVLNFLFGNILWATPLDIAILAGFSLLLFLLHIPLYKRFQLLCFDAEQARLQRLPIAFLHTLLFLLIAVTIVFLVKLVGAILVVVTLSLPAAISCNFTRSLKQTIFVAVFIAIGINTIGMVVAYMCNLPPGATLSLVATCCYIATLFFQKIRRNRLVN